MGSIRQRLLRPVLVVGATSGLILGPTGAAGAVLITPPGATIAVTPAFGLVNGQEVSVAGTGMTPIQQGALLECNTDPSQPTVSYSGIPIPVSCSSIFGQPDVPVSVPTLVATTSTGTFSGSFVVRTGVLGPPTAGTDSAGNDAAADAAQYPCPPTPTQRAEGDACRIVFGDLANESVSEDIEFGPPIAGHQAVMAEAGYEAAGVSIDVRASGFAPDSPTLVQECNLTPGEPANLFGDGPAVGCSPPLATTTDPFVPVTDGFGSLDTTFTLAEGNIGANAVSAAYPCPPSPANVAAGGSCDIVVEDSGSNVGRAGLGLEGPVPVPTLAVSPSSGLLNGQQVAVTGSGFAADSNGVVVECNETPGEPTMSIDGVALPVGCNSPFGGLFQSGFADVAPDGTFATTYTVATGVLGPPQPDLGGPANLDSVGVDGALDAARYPCPPTAAQRALGATCALSFFDAAGDVASAPISFGSPRTFSPEIEVLAQNGTLDVTHIPDGTQVTVTGSGFTPQSPTIVFECEFGPGAPAGPPVLGVDCIPIGDSGSVVAGTGGDITETATVIDLSDFFGYGPQPTPCAIGAPLSAGTCQIVVQDAAGNWATVPIGMVEGPRSLSGEPPGYIDTVVVGASAD